MKKILILAVYIVGILSISVLLFMLGTSYRISDPTDVEMLKQFHISQFLRRIFPQVPDLPKIIIKERLGAIDALINVLTILATGVPTLVLIILVGIISAIWFILSGLFTANWDKFLLGLVIPLGVVVFSLGICLYVIMAWWILLFQPGGTPAYVVIWIIVGLPVILVSFWLPCLFYSKLYDILHPPIRVTLE